MSANPFELFTAPVEVSAARRSATGPVPDRRKRPRIRVHWPVILFRSQVAAAIQSMTQDLSSSGFYCLTSVPLIPGEMLISALKVPFHDPNGKHLERSLECTVRVVRVEPIDSEGTFGVGCHIEDYHFADALGASPSTAPDSHRR